MRDVINPSVPSRKEAEKAGAIVGSMYENMLSAQNDLVAAQDEIHSLRTRLHTALKQIDERDSRIFMLEQERTLHMMEREAFVTIADSIFSDATRMKEHIATSVLNDLDRRTKESKEAASNSIARRTVDLTRLQSDIDAAGRDAGIEPATQEETRG